MSESVIAVFIPIILGLGAFLMVLGIRFLENKENMAMIERGMEPRKNRRQADPTKTLRNGMVFVGAGIGLALAIMINNMFNVEDARTGIYFAMIAIFGGLGMLLAYFYERRNPPQDL